MRGWEYKGEPFKLMTGMFAFTGVTILLVIYTLSVLVEIDFWTGRVASLTLCCVAIGFWFVKLPDSVKVHSSGAIEIKLGYVRGSICWSGSKDDVESLEYQTYDTGDGDVNFTVLSIKERGSICLYQLNLKDTKEMADALGVILRETKVDRFPNGQWRRQLLARLG